MREISILLNLALAVWTTVVIWNEGIDDIPPMYAVWLVLIFAATGASIAWATGNGVEKESRNTFALMHRAFRAKLERAIKGE